ncbi:MAG: sensor histidine kinase RegB [Roseinatronobacter sp.]
MTSPPPLPAFGEISQDHRGDWVRLRTMTYVRMLALTGQFGAVLVAELFVGLDYDRPLVWLVMGAAALSILCSWLMFPATKRLTDTEAFLTFLFDIALLVCLLYLTGGITNPFSLLILAPVAVSAMALKPRSTLILSLLAIALVTLIAWRHEPLRFVDGTVLTVPPLFAFGFWAAIVIGILFQAFYAHRVAAEATSLANALLAAQMALSREQKLTDLGGVVAATAHELGTPLATIKLIASELSLELNDQPELAEDARILVEQADRCRDILRSMGRAGKDDTHLRRAPLEAVLAEAAEPHMARGKKVQFEVQAGPGGRAEQPVILRRPEIIHGLRNLVQNAVDFAESAVVVHATWTDTHLSIRILDDGAGFSAQVLGAIGEPFLRRRREPARDPGRDSARPGYDGMGLGLFIAKTLLERSGAALSVANANLEDVRSGKALKGAQVTLVWPLARIAVDGLGPLPINPQFVA